VIDAASGPKELWFEPEAEHTGVYGMDPDRYANRLDAFFTRGLASTNVTPGAAAAAAQPALEPNS
jgi:hypothetical protein